MNQAGIRYNRVPDPAQVLSISGWVRGEERKTDNHRMRSPIKLSICVLFLSSVETRWHPVHKKITIKSSFIHLQTTTG
jgi:hypothetical protein